MRSESFDFFFTPCPDWKSATFPFSSCSLLFSGKSVFDSFIICSGVLLWLCWLNLTCHSFSHFPCLFLAVFLSGSLIQLPSVERGKLSKVRLGSLSLKKEGERQCFLFTKHFLICTRSSGGKLHLLKVRTCTQSTATNQPKRKWHLMHTSHYKKTKKTPKCHPVCLLCIDKGGKT